MKNFTLKNYLQKKQTAHRAVCFFVRFYFAVLYNLSKNDTIESLFYVNYSDSYVYKSNVTIFTYELPEWKA